MASPTRKIEYRPLPDLKPDPRNPKAHALDEIDASVGRFGFVEPIVLDGRTGFIISGHGRTKTLRAMHERGEAAPDGVKITKDGDWHVPVATGWSSRSDAEAAAALIALNRTTEMGGWVDDALLDLLDDLVSSGDEDALLGVGYTLDDLDDLTARLQEVEVDLPDEGESRDVGNTRETPSITEYAERYAEQGRRLIVLDYTPEEYGAVTAGLRALREETGAESNSEAIQAFLAGKYPDLGADEEETNADDDE